MLYTKHASITTTDTVTLLTMPADHMAVIQYIFVMNHAGPSNTINLWYEISATPIIYIYENDNINSGNATTLGNGGGPLFVLHNREILKASTGSAGDIDIAVTFDLTPRNTDLVGFI